jgi:mono/diheme cytochrome c family protein
MLEVRKPKMGITTKILVGFAFGLFLRANTYAAQDQTDTNTLVARGAYLATASDCTACHTAPKGKPFAGGLAISTPLGTIYSTNITPSKGAGIGQYTEEEFSRALRAGIRRDGANLYPAMPYTSYAKFTDADVHALYAYFMHDVAPVDAQSPPTELPFPMNIRLSMKAWNLLFLDRHGFVSDPSRSPEWNRGAYLAQGAAHCSTCHTPRGFLMQENSESDLGGADVGPWHAPNITSDPFAGIGSWSQAETVQYLRTGRIAGKAQAAGSMAEAIQNSFQYLSADDLNALATYIKSVPPVRDPSDNGSRFENGKRLATLGTLRGIDGITTDMQSHLSGAALFQGNCASCHSAKGDGSSDDYYPSLFHNSTTGASSPVNLIATILYGVNRTTAHEQAFMPGFGGTASDANQLSDSEIVLLGNYVLQQFGRGNIIITQRQVAQVRHGGASSNLILLARAGILIAFIVVLLALAYLVRKRRRRSRYISPN